MKKKDNFQRISMREYFYDHVVGDLVSLQRNLKGTSNLTH